MQLHQQCTVRGMRTAGMANEFDSRGGISWHPAVLILCALTLAGAHSTTAAAQRIGIAELLSST